MPTPDRAAPFQSQAALRLRNDVECGKQLFAFLSDAAQATISSLGPFAGRIAAINLTDKVRTMLLDIELTEANGARPRTVPMSANIKRQARMLLDILRIADIHLVLKESHRFVVEFFCFSEDYGRSPRGGVPPPRRLDDPAPRHLHLTTRLDRKPRRPNHNPQAETTPILFPQLKWFTWHAGRHLDGTLIDQGETDSGNVICLLRGDEGTTMKAFIAFPCLAMMHRGAKVRIRDPYLRVDNAGEVSIRVDCRSDLKVFPLPAPSSSRPLSSTASKGSSRLAEAKAAGDGRLRTKSFNDALRVYMGFLRDEMNAQQGDAADDVDFIATVLNNMSQCYLNDGAYPEALTAAAWVLLLRPENAKARGRYDTALARWVAPASETAPPRTAASLLAYSGGIPSITTDSTAATRADLSMDARIRRKEEGNAHFAEERWAAALGSYSAALRGYELYGTLLSNVALTLFECRQWIPLLCVAPMAAYFNAKVRDKNTSRYVFALLQLNRRDDAELLLKGIDAASDIHQQAAQVIREKYERAVPRVKEAHHDCVAPLSLQAIPGKGRGLVAIQDIEAGDVVLLEHALGAWSGREDEPFVTPPEQGGSHRIASERFHYGRTVLLPSERHTFRFLEQRIGALPFPSTLLHELYLLCDTDPSSQLLLPAASGQPLDLAAHTDGWLDRPFADPFPALSLDVGRICEIVIANSCATNEPNQETDSTGLFALASLMNHDDNPNTHRDVCTDRVSFRAVRRIPKGEEVTTAYFSLERNILEPELPKRWGVPQAAFPDANTEASVRAHVTKLHAQLERFHTQGLESDEVSRLGQEFQAMLDDTTIPVPWKNILLGAALSVRACYAPLELLPEAPLYVAFVERTGVCVHPWALLVIASRLNEWRSNDDMVVDGGLKERIARLVDIHIGKPTTA